MENSSAVSLKLLLQRLLLEGRAVRLNGGQHPVDTTWPISTVCPWPDPTWPQREHPIVVLRYGNDGDDVDKEQGTDQSMIDVWTHNAEICHFLLLSDDDCPRNRDTGQR